MQIVAFTPAAAHRFATLASTQRLTDAEICAVLRGFRETHPTGIIPVETVSRVVTTVLIASCKDALATRAATGAMPQLDVAADD